MKQWQIVFFIAAGIYIFCATFYNLFGSGVRQAWDNPLNDDTSNAPAHQNGNCVTPATTNLPLQQPGQNTTIVNGNGVHETRQ